MDESRRKFYEAIATRSRTFAKGFYEKFDVNDLNRLNFSRDLFRGQHGLPMVVFDPALPATKNGKPSPRNKCSIFGAPSKMACLTFSLPAGPPGDKYQGTCPASGYEVNSPAFICNGCYALSGNYVLYPDVIRKGLVLRQWAMQAVKAGAFAELMTTALQAAFAIPAKRRIFKVQGKVTDVSTNDFFRIHDSGDFFSAEYFRQWCQVAANFPRTLFWAPTRVGLKPDGTVSSAWVRLFSQAPENMIVRPSALFFEDPPPMIEGMAAGAAATRVGFKGAWRCPAYDKDSPADRNCKSARCRHCWTNPDEPVFYYSHGGAIGRVYAAAGLKVSANPPASAMEPQPDALAGEGDSL